MFNADEFQVEALEAENKRLNEEIARLEKERESEPVSKHICMSNAKLCFKLDSEFCFQHSAAFN